MRERRLVSSDGKTSIPFQRAILTIEKEEDNAQIVAQCGPDRFVMWKGKIEDAQEELKHAVDYCMYFFSFVYRFGVKTKTKTI